VTSATAPSIGATSGIFLAAAAKAFRLIFEGLRENGVTPIPAARLVLDSFPRGRMTAMGNGYFHVEARLPHSTHPRVYRLVGASSSAAVVADATGEAPRQTVSPVSESYCMTVVAGPRAQLP
jgi:ketosteroid isomerase-like protein